MSSCCQVCHTSTKNYYVKNEGLSYHRFPVGITDVCRKWVSFCTLPDEKLKNRYICSRHFKQSDYMSLSSNRLMPEAVPTEDMAKEVQEKFILHWNYRGFVELPDELKLEGEHIKEVYLKWNNLQKLPQWLGVLKNLTNLYLYGNGLKSLPEEIEQLPSLVYLDVGQNQLSFLPANIGKLHNLTALAATNNQLTSLPNEIKELSSMRVLQLAGNMLQTLPESVCMCENLEELCLDQNSLLSLPPQIVYLPKLQALSVTGNQLLYLPALPFVSDINLRFDDNPCLNYLSYPLGCQITTNNQYIIGDGLWGLKCFGCFQTSISDDDHLKNAILCVPPDPREGCKAMRLVMPHGLRNVCMPIHGATEVPSLFEIAMRATYGVLYFHSLNSLRYNESHTISTFRKPLCPWDKSHIFPSNIEEQLRRGPVTICYHPDCQVPIFTYAVVWIVSKYNAGRETVSRVLASIFFCSQYCSSSYELYEALRVNERWEHYLSTTKIEWHQKNAC